MNQYPAAIVLAAARRTLVDDDVPPWNPDESCVSLIICSISILLWADSRVRAPGKKPVSFLFCLNGFEFIIVDKDFWAIYSPHFETPYKTDQSSRKGETISLDLLLLKRIVLHLSTMFCLTGFVCQLAFVRTRKKPIERMKEIWKGRPGELWAARCSLATKKRQKNEPEGSQRQNHSSFLFPSSFFALLLTYMADGPLQNWGKWTSCVLLIPRLHGQQLK